MKTYNQLLEELKKQEAVIKKKIENVQRINELLQQNSELDTTLLDGEKPPTTKKKITDKAQPEWGNVFIMVDKYLQILKTNTPIPMPPKKKAKTEVQKGWAYLSEKRAEIMLIFSLFKLKFLTGIRVPTLMAIAINDIQWVPWKDKEGKLISGDGPGLSRYFAGVIITYRQMKTVGKDDEHPAVWYGCSKLIGTNAENMDVLRILWGLSSAHYQGLVACGEHDKQSGFLGSPIFPHAAAKSRLYHTFETKFKRASQKLHQFDPALSNLGEPIDLNLHDTRAGFRTYMTEGERSIPLSLVLEAGLWAIKGGDTPVSRRYNKPNAEIYSKQLEKLTRDRKEASSEIIPESTPLIDFVIIHPKVFQYASLFKNRPPGYLFCSAKKIVEKIEGSRSKTMNPSELTGDEDSILKSLTTSDSSFLPGPDWQNE